jgi:hypothetical protein
VGRRGVKRAWGWDKTAGDLKWAIYCFNWHPRARREKRRRLPGAARIATAPGGLSSGERKKKGKGRGEADRRGRRVSGSRKKRKKDGGTWPLREGACGPTGRLGRKVRRVSSFFIFFLFQTLFKSNFSF